MGTTTRKPTVTRQCSRFVGKKILDSAKLLGQCARAHNRLWNLRVILNLTRVECLGHVQVDSQTGVLVSFNQIISQSSHLIGIIEEKRMRNRKT